MTLFGRRSNANDGAVTFRVPVLVGSCCMVACLATFNANADEPEADPVRAAFAAADADGSRTLTLEEFNSTESNRDVARRDFRLFDFDQNSLLTVEEFAAIPGRVPAAQRGPIPDPFDHLYEASLATMDAALKRVVPEDSRNIDSKTFLLHVAIPILMGGVGRGGTLPSPTFDEDRNNNVTRSEAERFLKVALGMRASTGERLRAANGRIVNFGRFLRLDVDHNQRLEPDEYDGTSNEFSSRDSDRNRSITLDEFSTLSGPEWFDPVVWFRDADTDLDGLLNMDEARAATDPSLQILIEPCYRAFDQNGDGKFSLEEYRLSMLGNPVGCWTQLPRDTDENYSLALDEFNFGENASNSPGRYDSRLLKLYYFHRLDANKDHKLSQDEFPFKARPPGTMKLLAADGSELLPLYINEEYPHCGSPAVSPDGKTIAFDGRRAGQSLQHQRILMIDRDGGGFRDVCGGLMPTWSPDGSQFTCSRYEPQHGIWIIDADGSNARWIVDGWGAQWSPDGKMIAYTNDRGVWAYDVATEATREILSADEHPYQLIYWNMCWSPDSRRLVFKGRKQRGNDVASISMVGDDPDLQVHLATELRVEPDFAWSLDGQRIVFCMDVPDLPNDLLYELNPQTDDPPRLLKGIDKGMAHNDCCFTPDGKWMIVGATESAERGL